MRNSTGREVPCEANGRTLHPYMGVGVHRPTGPRYGPLVRSCAEFPLYGDKRSPSLRAALEKAGLKNGDVVSSHHHLRNGDELARQLFAAADEMGVRDLVWFPSAVFPCHAELIPYLERGVIHHIEGSLNGPLGEYASRGKMNGLAVLRSHGGRYRTLQDGEVVVNVAVLAAPACDMFGNMSGTQGPSACGSLGFGLADAQFADHVIAVTDALVPIPCLPAQIAGNYVDQVVEVDRLGDPSLIVSGTTQLTRSPDRLLISELCAAFVKAAGIMREGFSFQAGAGGISLAFTLYLAELMRREGVKARFIRGGSTQHLVEMLEEGLTDFILDGQTFDAAAVASMRDHPDRHIATSPFNSYSYHGKGNIASMLDCAVLGATEVDLEFNANVATHSDGLLLHGLGGWSDALFAKCTILAAPCFRNRVPVIRDTVTTLCGPGELIDVVVTERGLAVNPRRGDLAEAIEGAGLPVRTLEELKAEAEQICGEPDSLELTEERIGVVTWVDGTAIDSVYRPAHLEASA